MVLESLWPFSPSIFATLGPTTAPEPTESTAFLLMTAIMFVPLEVKPRNVLTQDIGPYCSLQSLSGP